MKLELYIDNITEVSSIYTPNPDVKLGLSVKDQRLFKDEWFGFSCYLRACQQ